MAKRNNELVENVKKIIESCNLSLEEKRELNQLLSSYQAATYKEYEDRHKFYRDEVSNMINDFGFEADEMANAMAHEHPTLQQSFMRLCLKFITKMANQGYVDGRNEASVAMAKKMINAIGENGYLPCI